ncbi:MAG: L,D-transpeptidase [Bdellovibrionota bacterium]
MKLKIILITLLTALSIFSTSAYAQGKAVQFSRDAAPGTIEIHAKERALYFVYESGHAIRYPVAVPKQGMQWSGYARIDGKHWAPAWAPPAIVKRDHPELPDYIAGGSPDNPMGAAALTLDRDQIAIHGTTKKMRKSIGTSASYGCIRMLNEDVTDLYGRVSVGTVVLMRN